MLAIVNSAAMNIGVHVSFLILLFSGYMPNSGINGSYDSFIPSFLRNLHTVLQNDCIGLHSHQQTSHFSTPFAAFVIYILFDDGHSDWYEVVPHYSFDLHFSNN